MDLEFQGSFQLVTRDSLYVSFTPEIPPFLTETRAEFQLIGDTLIMKDSNTTFDFDGDQMEEEAIFEGTLVWTGF